MFLHQFFIFPLSTPLDFSQGFVHSSHQLDAHHWLTEPVTLSPASLIGLPVYPGGVKSYGPSLHHPVTLRH